MKIKEAYDFLSNNAKRVEYDNKQAQQKRDAQRWAAYQVVFLGWNQTRGAKRRAATPCFLGGVHLLTVFL